MNFTIKFCESHIEICFTGMVTMRDIEFSFKEITKNRSWNNQDRVLLDYRNADLAMLKKYSELEKISSLMLKNKEVLAGIKAVDVFSDEQALAYAYVEKSIRDFYKVESNYYATTDYNEAIHWLLGP